MRKDFSAGVLDGTVPPCGETVEAARLPDDAPLDSGDNALLRHITRHGNSCESVISRNTLERVAGYVVGRGDLETPEECLEVPRYVWT